MKRRFGFFAVYFFLAVQMAFGHGNGRLLDVQVVNGKLVAQGYNSGTADGLDTVRPFVNSIHDHFSFVGSDDEPLGMTLFPSWDIGFLPGSDISALIGYEVTVEIVGSGKWINIPAQDGTGLNQDFGTPELFEFTNDYLQNNSSEIITVTFNGQQLNTRDLGEFVFSESVSGVIQDLDFEYMIDNHNDSEIYFIEFRLKTDAPGIQDSDPIYAIQSPDGMGPVERLHFQSLYLEAYLGQEIKEILRGDVNLDGVIDLLDVDPFVSLLTSGSYQIEADINNDGFVDLFDITPFVDLLTGN